VKQNLGSMDRTVRLIVAIVIGVLWFNGTIRGLFGIILGIVAIAFVVTALVGWCPLYAPLGISTHRRMGGQAS